MRAFAWAQTVIKKIGVAKISLSASSIFEDSIW
jgi:hypothetical protein